MSLVGAWSLLQTACKSKRLLRILWRSLSAAFRSHAVWGRNCQIAVHAGSTDADPAKWKVTQEMMEREIKKVRRAKKEHEGESGKARRIGFYS